MKIFATGDTHGNFERFRPEYFPEGQELTKEDVVLQLGDFGGVWFGDERDDEALDWLKGLPFTVAFVSGNHENYDALVKYPIENWHGGRVQPIRPHVLHLMRGQVFELAGRTFFTMGGAASHDIEDGILSLEDPNFERKYLTLKRKEHARFRIDPGGGRSYPRRRNMQRPDETWTPTAGRWTTSSLTAPPPALLSSSPGTMWRTT